MVCRAGVVSPSGHVRCQDSPASPARERVQALQRSCSGAAKTSEGTASPAFRETAGAPVAHHACAFGAPVRDVDAHPKLLAGGLSILAGVSYSPARHMDACST